MSDTSMSAQDVKVVVKLNPLDLEKELDYILSVRKPDGTPKSMMVAFIWGGPGIGKTQIIGTHARKRDHSVVAIHLPQWDPADIKGIPVNLGNGRIKWVNTSYLPQDRVYEDQPGSHTRLEPEFPNRRNIWLRILRDGEEVGIFGNDLLGNHNPLGLKVVFFGKKAVEITGDIEGLTFVVAEKAYLFADELSAANESTQKATLQLFNDGQVNEYIVPFGVPLIAAGNTEDDGAYINQMSAPMCNRFAHFILVPSMEASFAFFAERKFPSEYLTFLANGGMKKLYDYQEDALSGGDCGFPTPRSWTRFMEQTYKGMPKERVRLYAQAFLGSQIATDLDTYLSTDYKMPKTDDILSGKITEMPDDVLKPAHFRVFLDLSYKMGDIYKETLANKESKAWDKACLNGLTFIRRSADVGVSDELVTLAFFTLTRVLGMPLTAFRGRGLDLFEAKYTEFLSQMFR